MKLNLHVEIEWVDEVEYGQFRREFLEGWRSYEQGEEMAPVGTVAYHAYMAARSSELRVRAGVHYAKDLYDCESAAEFPY